MDFISHITCVSCAVPHASAQLTEIETEVQTSENKKKNAINNMP